MAGRTTPKVRSFRGHSRLRTSGLKSRALKPSNYIAIPYQYKPRGMLVYPSNLEYLTARLKNHTIRQASHPRHHSYGGRRTTFKRK